MEEREIGASGLRFSRIVLGGGNFGGVGSAPEFFGRGESEEEAFRIMDAAWGLGITTFDTADAYGGGRSETAIGRWMHRTGNRPTLTTKTYNPMADGADHGLGRRRMGRQLESSLERLGVDAVELFLAHEFDADTPLEETIETFEQLRETGLIRAWGVSNFDADQLGRVLVLGGRPALVQNSYSLLDRRDEQGVIPLCIEEGITYEAYSPLAGGWLTGKYQRDETPPPDSRMAQRPEPYEHLRSDAVFAALDAFQEFAERRGVDMATLAFAWVLGRPGVTAVVTGPRRPQHLAPAVAALAVELADAERDELGTLFAG